MSTSDQHEDRYHEDGNGDFENYKKLILSELRRLNEEVNQMHKDIKELREEAVVFRLKLSLQAAIWGGVVGLIPVVVVLLMKSLK